MATFGLYLRAVIERHMSLEEFAVVADMPDDDLYDTLTQEAMPGAHVAVRSAAALGVHPDVVRTAMRRDRAANE